jgi:Zn-dependent protease with chaperone function
VTGVTTLLVGSTLVGLLGHRPLLWLADRRVDATVLLTGWVLSTLGLVASMLSTVGLLALLTGEHSTAGLFQLAGGCLTAISGGSVPGWREALAAVGTTGTTGIILRLMWVVGRRVRAVRRQAPHLQQLRLLAGLSAPDEPLWVRDDRPLAASVAGRPGIIIMSDTLRQQLTPAAVAATLEHERAHLRGRHHLLVAVVESLSTALPICPLLRAAPGAVSELVELAADAQAARRCGPAAVREALCRLTGQPASTLGLAMTGGITQMRLTWLSTGSVGRHPAVRLAGCLTAAAGGLLLPAASGWLAVNAVGCVVA